MDGLDLLALEALNQGCLPATPHRSRTQSPSLTGFLQIRPETALCDLPLHRHRPRTTLQPFYLLYNLYAPTQTAYNTDRAAYSHPPHHRSMNYRSNGRAFQRSNYFSSMLPSPSTARTRLCSSSLRHPRVTTIAAVILIVACLYHARGFKPDAAPTLERSYTPVAADGSGESLIVDGAGGPRFDDSERVGAGGPDISDGAGGPDIGAGGPDVGAGGPDVGAGGPDIGAGGPDITDSTLAVHEAGAGGPDIVAGDGGPDVTEGDGGPVIHEDAGADGPDVSDGAGGPDVTEHASVVHDAGDGGPDITEGAGGPDVSEGGPAGFEESSEKQEDYVPPATEDDGAMEAVVDKEITAAAADSENVDGAERQEENVEGQAAAEGEQLDTADKQEGEIPNAEEAHGDAIDSADKQEDAEEGAATLDSGDAIADAEKLEAMPEGETAVDDQSLPEAEKQETVVEQAAEGESVETSEKQEDENIDPAEKAAEGEQAVAAEERQEDVAVEVEGAESADADNSSGGDYALGH